MHQPEQWITGVRHSFSRLGGASGWRGGAMVAPPREITLSCSGKKWRAGGCSGRVARVCRSHPPMPLSRRPTARCLVGEERVEAGAGGRCSGCVTSGCLAISQCASPIRQLAGELWGGVSGVVTVVLRSSPERCSGKQWCIGEGGWRWCDVV